MSLLSDMTQFFSLLPSSYSSSASPNTSAHSKAHETPFPLDEELCEESGGVPGFAYASSSSGSSDGARTPDSGSPALLPHPHTHSNGNEKAQREAEEQTWELPSEPEVFHLPPPHPHPTTSFTLKKPRKPLPALPSTISASSSSPLQPKVPSHHLLLPKPSSPTSHSHSLPIAKSRSSPITSSKPSRSSNSHHKIRLTPSEQQEEEDRGRSRWPRLLWRSEVDEEQLKVLEKYHERAVGGPLPVMKGRGRKEVGEWSRRMEKAGL